MAVRAVAATEKPSAPAYHQWYQPAGKGESFYTGDDGYQYVDNMRVDDVRSQVQDSPFYLYSKQRITSNYMAYKKALEGIDSIIGYAVKANNNMVIMKHLQQLGSGAVLVSGNELKAAMAVGFNPTRLVMTWCRTRTRTRAHTHTHTHTCSHTFTHIRTCQDHLQWQR
jgi:diaminopimelate decarboxylase